MDRDTRLRVALDLTKEVIARDVDMPLRTVGLSMRPTVRGGDRLVVRRGLPADLAVGDIVLYEAGDRFVAHRVIRIRRDDAGRVWLTVKGDAHLGADGGELAAERVVGRAVAVRRGRRTLDLLHPRRRRVDRWIARYSSAVDWGYRWWPWPRGVLGQGRAAGLLGTVARGPIRFLNGLPFGQDRAKN